MLVLSQKITLDHNIINNPVLYFIQIFPLQRQIELFKSLTYSVVSIYSHEIWPTANHITGKWRSGSKNGFYKNLSYSVYSYTLASRLFIYIATAFEWFWVEFVAVWAEKHGKMASGGMVCIKYLLFLFNFIFWVS